MKKRDTLKSLREANQLTQKELACTAGVTEVSYQRYEYSKRVPDACTAIKIAKALGTTVEKLWGGNPAAK